jgi:hypothetical protein
MQTIVRWPLQALAIMLALLLAIGDFAPSARAQEPEVRGLRVNIVSGNDQTVVLGSGATFRNVVVRVVDSAGKPVKGALVNFTLEAGGVAADGSHAAIGLLTDEQGMATLTGIKQTAKAGSWSIRVRASYQKADASAAINMMNGEAGTAAPAPVVTPAPPPTTVAAGTPPPAAVKPAPPPTTAAPRTATASPVPPAPKPTSDVSTAPPPLARPPVAQPPQKKSSKTALIIIILAVAAGGGAAAALAGKKSPAGAAQSSSPPQPSSTVTIGIGSGGGFGTPGGPH